jgi:hypothetical protein
MGWPMAVTTVFPAFLARALAEISRLIWLRMRNDAVQFVATKRRRALPTQMTDLRYLFR